MKKVAFWLGVLCLLYVGLGLVAGLLPVEGWEYLFGLFVEQEPNTFYKVVPTEGAKYQTLIAALVGVLLLAYSKPNRNSKPKGDS